MHFYVEGVPLPVAADHAAGLVQVLTVAEGAAVAGISPCRCRAASVIDSHNPSPAKR